MIRKDEIDGGKRCRIDLGMVNGKGNHEGIVES